MDKHENQQIYTAFSIFMFSCLAFSCMPDLCRAGDSPETPKRVQNVKQSLKKRRQNWFKTGIWGSKTMTFGCEI